MATLDELIASHINPFDFYVSGDFFQTPVGPEDPVEAIHRDCLERLKTDIRTAKQRRRPYTSLVVGQSGAGKTFLLGRLQRDWGRQARFAYIGPWADGERIWRHTLRHTVQSLLYPPQRGAQSQLMQWFHALHRICTETEPKRFKDTCSRHYSRQVENGRLFFRVIAGLAHEDSRELAIAWLRGDELDTDDLQDLGVKRAVDDEETAKSILLNLLRVCPDEQPIVLCFDQLDNVPHNADGQPDLSPLFSLNSQIHTGYNDAQCLVVISLITETYLYTRKHVTAADHARLNSMIDIKPIPVNQIKLLWQHRLAPLHRQATPKPANPLVPLDYMDLETKFPRGKYLIRTVLRIGYNVYQAYKDSLPKSSGGMPDSESEPVTDVEEFLVIWEKTYAEIDRRTRNLTEEASEDLIWYVAEALQTLALKEVKRNFLSPAAGTHAAYRSHVRGVSLSYYLHAKKFGLAWTESDNLTRFYWVMRIAEAAVQRHDCDVFILIRHTRLGKPTNRGHQIYTRLIHGDGPHDHIKPTVLDLKILRTLHELINKAKEKSLTLERHPIDLATLQELVRASNVLARSDLLKQLEVVKPGNSGGDKPDFSDIQQNIFNTVVAHDLIGLQTLEERTREQHPKLDQAQFDQQLEVLIQQNKLKKLDPNAPREQQLICRVPDA